MSYLGNAPARSFISFERQVFTIVNSQTAYALSHSVTNENDIRLVINNVVQEPGSGKAYTATGTALTLSAALTNGTDEMYCVFLGRATATSAPGAGSIGTAQLAADAVTNAKIADDAISDEQLDPTVITGQTAETSIATDDLILLSDTSASGALKKMTRANFVSGVGGIANAQAFYLSGSKSGSSGVGTVIDTAYTAFDASAVNASVGTIGSASNVTVSSGVFSFASTGYYLILTQMNFYMAGSDETRYVLGTIQATYNNSSYGDVAQGASQIANVTGANENTSVSPQVILNVDNTSNVKFRLKMQGVNTLVTETQTKGFRVTIIKLADV